MTKTGLEPHVQPTGAVAGYRPERTLRLFVELRRQFKRRRTIGVVREADRHRASVPDDLLDGALGDLLPLGHDHHVAAGLLDLGEQVAGDDDRAPGGGVGPQHLAHGVDLRRV